MLSFIRFESDIELNKYGLILFYIGIFFLPSAFFISIILLLSSALIGSYIQKESYFQCNWNKVFYICGFLQVINALTQRFFLDNSEFINWDSNLTLIGLANWIPFFWVFWAFQPFLNTTKKRKIISILLISGSLPVIVTGFGQYFFNWTGPIQTLNGLITWYQRPITDAGLTGLFNNSNYAGSWLNFIWPFSIAIFLDTTKRTIKKIISTIFLISISLSIFLTNSRNAWGGLISSIPLVIGTESLLWILPSIIFIMIIIFFCNSPLLTGELQDYIRNIIPDKFWLEFSEEGFENLDITRINLLLRALKISLIRPLFGIGAASFTVIFASQTGFWKGHAHNLFIELAISYGLPVALIFTFTLFLLFTLSFRKLYIRENSKEINYFERAWWASCFIFFLTQLLDVQYFDGRISLFAWILLAGIKNILEGEKIERFVSQ